VPDARRFAVVLVPTAHSVTGAIAGFTCVVAFLDEVSGFSDGSVSALLLVFGAAGIVGISAAGRLLDRFPRGTPTVPVASQAVARLGPYAGRRGQAVRRWSSPY